MGLFGTDGIRDLVNGEKMNPGLAVRMGMAIVAFCQKRNLPLKIVIGRDTRGSGPMLEDAVAAGAVAMGAEVVSAGVVPTPGLAYLVKEQGAGAGLVISASHNHFGYNGLKPFKNDGTKLDSSEEAELEKYILESDFPKNIGQDFIAGRKIDLADAGTRYVDFILQNLPEYFGNRDLKLVIDCANGATHKVAPDIFKHIFKDVDVLFADPDGKNINAGCGSQYVGGLRERVLEKRADLGLAFDGDGDRVIAIDEMGGTLSGDQIIYIIANMLKDKGVLKNDLVVTTVMSNLGFVRDLKDNGISHKATDVGDRPVFFEMNRSGAVLGGEESGHIIYSDYHPAGDGIIGGLMLIAAMNHFKRPLSELAREITLFPKLLVNVEVSSKPEISSVPEIFSAIKMVEEKLGDLGRVLVRYSGTENLCRVMIEGADEAGIAEDADRIAKIIREKLS